MPLRNATPHFFRAGSRTEGHQFPGDEATPKDAMDIQCWRGCSYIRWLTSDQPVIKQLLTSDSPVIKDY